VTSPVPLPPEGDIVWYDWATFIHNIAVAAVESTTMRNIVSLTQAQYNAITTPDPATLYLITG
jgi:hypothetical protein